MEQHPDIRLRFREWLIEQDLEPETAYGILESVPPYDWSLIARRDEMNERFDRVDVRLDRVAGDLGSRIDGVDAKLDRVAGDLGSRIDGMAERIDGMAERIDGFAAQVAAVNRTLAVGALTLAVTMVLGFGSLLAGILFSAS